MDLPSRKAIPLSSRESLLLLFIALTVHFCLWREITSWSGFYANFMTGTDMQTYLEQARGFVHGTWPGKEPFFRMPLYPLWLALFLLLGRSFAGAALIQGFFMSFSILLCAYTASQIWGRRAGWMAGILFLLYGGAQFWSTVFHSTAMEIFFASLFLYTFTSYRSEAGRFKAFSLGFCGAMVVLIRPNFLPGILILLGGLFWEKKKELPWKQWALLLIPFLLPLFFVSLHNTLCTGKLQFISVNGGHTYQLGNSYDSTIYNFIYPQKPLMPLSSLAFWNHLFGKAFGYWRSWEYPNNINFYIFREHSQTLSFLFLPHAVLATLTLLGSFLFLKKFTLFWPYLFLFWSYYASVVLFFIIGRFRAPAVPLMCFISAGFLEILFSWLKQKKRWHLAIISLCSVVIFFLMKPFEVIVRSWDRQNHSSLALVLGDGKGAEEEIRRLLEEPLHPYLRPLSVADRQKLKWKKIQIQMMEKKNEQALAGLEELRKEIPENPFFWEIQIQFLRNLGEEKKARFLEEEYNKKKSLLLKKSDTIKK